MGSVEALSKKRSFAKKNFTLNYNKLQPLLNLVGAEASDSVQDVKDLMVKVESCFSKAHETYLEALQDETVSTQE